MQKISQLGREVSYNDWAYLWVQIFANSQWTYKSHRLKFDQFFVLRRFCENGSQASHLKKKFAWRILRNQNHLSCEGFLISMVELTVNYRIKQCLSGVFPMFCIHLFLNKILKNNDQRYQQQGSGLFLVTNTGHLNREMFHVPYRRTANFVTIIWFFYLSLQRIYKKNIASAAFWDCKEHNQITQGLFL